MHYSQNLNINIKRETQKIAFYVIHPLNQYLVDIMHLSKILTKYLIFNYLQYSKQTHFH